MLLANNKPKTNLVLWGKSKLVKEAIDSASKTILYRFVQGEKFELTNDLVHRQALQEVHIACGLADFDEKEKMQCVSMVNSYFWFLRQRDIKIVLLPKNYGLTN